MCFPDTRLPRSDVFLVVFGIVFSRPLNVRNLCPRGLFRYRVFTGGRMIFKRALQTRPATPETPIAEHLRPSIHRVCRLGRLLVSMLAMSACACLPWQISSGISNSGRISPAPKHGTCSSFRDYSPSRPVSIRSRFSAGFRFRHNTGLPGSSSWRTMTDLKHPH